MPLLLLSSSKTKHDILALGECLLRLSPPGHGRIEFSKTLEVDVGGGEFNVAYACARLGLRGGFISKLPDHPIARIILNHARAAGMDVSHVKIEPYDGLGRKGRVGLNFTEVGIGARSSLTLYDRGHSSASQMKPEELDWNRIFSVEKTRWLHTGGVMASLSDDTAAIVKTALKTAQKAGAATSFDFNFRTKLWTPEKAASITRELLPSVDVLIGNEWDFAQILGIKSGGEKKYKPTVTRLVKKYPRIKAICTTRREVKSGLINHWGGILWHEGQFFESRHYQNLEIEDRIGSGDGFSGGIAFGFLRGMKPQEIVDFAAAYGALLHSTRGDTSQADLDEIMHVAKGGSAKIRR